MATEAATLHYRVITAIQERRIAGEDRESIAHDYDLPLLVVEALCYAIDTCLHPSDYYGKCEVCGGVVHTGWLTGAECIECAARAEAQEQVASLERALAEARAEAQWQKERADNNTLAHHAERDEARRLLGEARDRIQYVTPIGSQAPDLLRRIDAHLARKGGA